MIVNLVHLSLFPSLSSLAPSPLSSGQGSGVQAPSGLLILRKFPTLPNSMAVGISYIYLVEVATPNLNQEKKENSKCKNYP